MSKKAIVLLAEGFEEIEAVTPIDVLRRAGAQVTLAGLGSLTVTGAHGVTYAACIDVSQALDHTYDLIVFPGGMPGAKNLGDSAEARALAEKNLAEGRLVAALCAAPVMTLGAWGLLDGRKATCYPGMEGMFPGSVTFVADRVVTDGDIITSRGPGTALEFSITLAGRLFGERVSKQLAEGMLLK